MTLSPARAAARIAWRQARRNPWRSALVAAMVALPVAALSGTAVAIKAVVATPREIATEAMGTADIVIKEFSTDLRPGALLHELPAGTRVVTGRSVYTQNIVRGSVVYLPVEEYSAPVGRPPLRGRFVVLEGRPPARAGEVAVQPDALAAFGARIGQDIRLEDTGLTLHVTGTLVAPGQVREPIAVVGTGTLAGQSDVGLQGFWIDLPPGASVDRAGSALQSDPRVQGYETRATIAGLNHGATAAANGGAFAGAALALLGTGLIAAAAFVVGARRQLRLLGLVGAQGGEPRHVRATVLFGGVSLGLLGSVVGAMIGIAGAFALHPHLSRIAGRLVGPVELPLLPLLGSVALGTLAATLAALGPARSAARLSTLEMLSGRTPPPPKPGRLAGRGLVGVAAGGVLTGLGTAGHIGAVLTVGLVLMVAGFLVAIPLLVTWVGGLARYLPTIPRLAARDLARNGRRTGAALAAATIALALPIAVSATTLSGEAGERRVPFMEPDQLSISVSASGGHLAGRTGDLAAAVRTAFPHALVVPLVPTGMAPGRPGSGGDASSGAVVYAQGGTEISREGVSYVRSGVLWSGGPDLLRAFHAEQGIPALEAGKVVAIGPNSTDGGRVHLKLELENGERSLRDLPAVEAGATRYASLSNSGEYNYVISPGAAARLGLGPTRPKDQDAQLVFRARAPLSSADVERAKAIAARHPGASVLGLRDLGSHQGPLRTILSLAGAGVALAILAIVLALVGAESRRDRAILAAVGAEPRARRELAGASGLFIAGLAAVLAVPTGFVPVAVQEISQRAGNPVVVPWAAIGLVLLGVPLVAGALAAIGSRQPEAARMLRPLA